MCVLYAKDKKGFHRKYIKQNKKFRITTQRCKNKK